jgi:hypothetical protein
VLKCYISLIDLVSVVVLCVCVCLCVLMLMHSNDMLYNPICMSVPYKLLIFRTFIAIWGTLKRIQNCTASPTIDHRIAESDNRLEMKGIFCLSTNINL